MPPLANTGDMLILIEVADPSGPRSKSRRALSRIQPAASSLPNWK